jgi:tRNA-(ms[2]io[6]A)-hydroxylase
LLVFAMIEARSCERFRLLSEGLEDEDMRKFYRVFMESEAGHYTLFMAIAREYVDEDMLRARWKEILEYEKEILLNLTPRGDRIH